MKNFYEFAGEHPWLTFFLSLILLGTLEEMVKAICR